jgi:hypothetical protein
MTRNLLVRRESKTKNFLMLCNCKLSMYRLPMKAEHNLVLPNCGISRTSSTLPIYYSDPPSNNANLQ